MTAADAQVPIQSRFVWVMRRQRRTKVRGLSHMRRVYASRYGPWGPGSNRPGSQAHSVFRRFLVLRLLSGFSLRALVLARENLAVTGVDLNLLDSRLSRELDVEGVHQATVLSLKLGLFHGCFRRVLECGQGRLLSVGLRDLRHRCEFFLGGPLLRVNGT